MHSQIGGDAGNTMCDGWPQESGMQGPPHAVCSHGPGLSAFMPVTDMNERFSALSNIIQLHACAV